MEKNIYFGERLFKRGKFIWLDDPIPETENVVEDHYPTICYLDESDFHLELKTYPSLLSELYEVSGHDKKIIIENLGGMDKIRKMLEDYREKRLAEIEEANQE